MLGVGDFPEFALEEVKLKFKGKNDLQCFLGEEFTGGGGGFPRAAAASENSRAGKIQLVRTAFDSSLASSPSVRCSFSP